MGVLSRIAPRPTVVASRHWTDKCALGRSEAAHPPGPQGDTPAFPCKARDMRHPYRRRPSNRCRLRVTARAAVHHRRHARCVWLSTLLWLLSGEPVYAATPSGEPCPLTSLAQACSEHPQAQRSTSVVRPIATPARSACVPLVSENGGTTSDEISYFGPLITLLEHSAAQPEAECFFLARTLLDTLQEHFAEAGSPDGRPTSTALSLEQHLPSQIEHDVSCVSLLTPLQLDHVAEFLACVWELPHDLPRDLELHPATRHAFRGHIAYEEGCQAGISSIAVFTDGSFDGRVSSWAFAAIAECPAGVFLVAWARGQVRLPEQNWFIGAPDHSALSAERSAVFWASAWLLGLSSAITCTIHCDCLTAAYQASGKYGAASQVSFAAACRSLVQALEAKGQFNASSILHVRGHQGNPYNELADTLASAVSLGESSLPVQYRHVCHWAVHETLSWLWLSVAALRQPSLWPDMRGQTFVDLHGNATLCPEELRPQDYFGAQIGSVSTHEQTSTSAVIDGIFVSINVQSLCEDDSSSLPNRVPFVREQLTWLGCAVAGMQETRAKSSSTIVSASHIRFLSGCDDKGCLGVELWFSRTVPFAWFGSAPIKFSVEDFRVLHWTPRILLVRYVQGSLRILFVTCHAPTATSPDRDRWWKGFVDLLLHAANDDKVVILGDLNARLCDSVTGRIGDLVWEQDHRPPSPFARLLQGLDLWVPSTFQECHWGPSHTWCAPGSTATSRIDFIIVPSGWGVPAGGSSVLHHVDFGQTGLDHFAVQLRVQVAFTAKPAFRVAKQRFDCAKATQPEAAAVVQAIFDSAPLVPWSIDAHRHYHVIATHLFDRLAQHFPAKKGARRRAFFSDTTWSLRQQRTWLRRQAHRASAVIHSWDVLCAFRAWHGLSNLSSELGACFGRILTCVAQLRHAVTELRLIQPIFRKSLRKDKNQYLSEVATQAATSTTKDVIQRLRPLLGPPRRQQRGAAPLPAVRLEDGSLATTPAAAASRWLRHFSAAEHGGPISAEDLIDRCFSRQKAIDLDTLDISDRDLPSKYDLEFAFRQSKPGRAAGNDGMPPDLLHYFPGPVARLFYPVLLKIAFRLQEPLQFKGGSVSHIYKHKGDIADCHNHRGILISNNIGKGFHSAFRRKCGSWYDAAATPLQTGGRRGFPVTLASQTVRSYQEGCLARGKSTAIIFLDLKEAFHKVARPLVHGGDMSDSHLIKVMQIFGLPAGHMDLLRSYVQQESLLVGAGASSWAALMIKEFQEDSWLTVSDGLAVVETGTRPGDSLADIVFSFLFAAVLKQVRAALIAAGFDVMLPWSEAWFRSLCPTGAPDEHLAPIDVSWMDDLALLLSADAPASLVNAVQGAASTLIDECLKALLHPNLARQKR